MIKNIQFYFKGDPIPKEGMEQEYGGGFSTTILIWNRYLGGAIIPHKIGTQKFGDIRLDEGYTYEETHE